jgi:hypothetical protein
MTHLAEGLCLNALLTLKVENYLISLAGNNNNDDDNNNNNNMLVV